MAVPGREWSRRSSGHDRRDLRRDDAGGRPAGRRTNRTIMEADPPACHSLLGRFQRVCYLAPCWSTHAPIQRWCARQWPDQGPPPVTWPTDTVIAELPARARALEAVVVDLQPGHLAVGPAANDRLATYGRVGSELTWVRSPCRGGPPAQLALVPVRQRSRGSGRARRRPAPRWPHAPDPAWSGRSR
jgi:hypothetical protein